MPFKIVRNDICKMSVDVIVNAANTSLKRGGGVCGAIFTAAGAQELQAECDRIGKCPAGEAVITGGYKLPAHYIIHTAGPIWNGGKFGEAELLHNCYINSLHLALQHGCQSIAFPLISSGIYGYPKEQALQIAISAITDFLLSHEMEVNLVVFDKNTFVLSEKLFTTIQAYIDDNYAEAEVFADRRRGLRNRLEEIHEVYPSFHKSAPQPAAYERSSLRNMLDHLDETFSEMLLRLIHEKGLTDVQTYKRANIDRKLFSKIRNTKRYNPSKATVIAFAIALELNLDETNDLLSKAGYILSHSNKFDVIIEYFITKGNYNIYEINEVLFYFDQILLGL